MIIFRRPITSLKLLPTVVAFLLLATQAATATGISIGTVFVGNAGNAGVARPEWAWPSRSVLATPILGVPP